MITREEEVFQVVLNTLRDMEVDTTSIGRESTLTQIGLDSLGAIDLVFRLETAFNVSIPLDDFKVVTVGEAVHFLVSHVPPSSAAAAA